MQSKHLLAVLTLLAANNWITPLSCLGQNGTTTTGALTSAPRVAPKEIKHEPLRSMPSDITVPVPPDAKFLGGYRSQYTGSRQITELRFQSTNGLAKIADWYQKSLAGAGWKVKVGSATSKSSSLTASKAGAFCSMNFREAGANGLTSGSSPSSVVMLNYSATR